MITKRFAVKGMLYGYRLSYKFIVFVYIIGFLMEELLSHVSVMKGISYFLGIKFFMCAFFV